jgi:uncharacterized protein GlcG (DUF336 family)
MFNTKMSLTNNISSRSSWWKVSALALLTVSVNALAADPAPNHNDATKKPPVPAAHGPTLESSIEAATAAIEACLDKDQKAGVSVVDSAGVLKVLLAADGASERGVLSSTNKAVTALHFKAATSQLFKQKENDKALAEKIAANSNFNPRPGGVLLKNGDEIIGAIGVGGAKIDEECALAGIDKIEARPK